MITKEIVQCAVKKYIEAVEAIGDRAGGSDHLAHVSYDIMSVDEPVAFVQEGRTVYKLSFSYTLTRESEFTIYPDNPPVQWTKKAQIVVDENGERVDSPTS